MTNVTSEIKSTLAVLMISSKENADARKEIWNENKLLNAKFDSYLLENKQMRSGFDTSDHRATLLEVNVQENIQANDSKKEDKSLNLIIKKRTWDPRWKKSWTG